jgi:predicted SAM-dependent methyltransferase
MFNLNHFRDRFFHSLEYRLFGNSRPGIEAIKSFRREMKIARTSSETLPRFSPFAGKSNLKLHLGCGPDVRAGWVNVDINLNNDGQPDNPEFFNYDLRLGIPLPDESCINIYSSHFFEHLSDVYGQTLFRESFRVLSKGGRIRFCLPDYRNQVVEWLNNDRSRWHLLPMKDMFPGLDPETMPYSELLNISFYQYGEHVCFYDEERVIRILRSVGFSDAWVSEYQEGADLSDEIRRTSSFYIEGKK